MTAEHYGAVLARIDEHMKGTDLKLAEVLRQVTATNGRLRAAEKWVFLMRLAGAGMIAVLAWLVVYHVKP